MRWRSAAPKLEALAKQVRAIFVDPAAKTLRFTTWQQNDFGRWGWNLRRGGAQTAYYVRTTPPDENATAQGKAVFLTNSHGCIHLKPNDRDELDRLGYLKERVELEVRTCVEMGPP